MSRKTRKRDVIKPDLTPMIDVVFLLLIFFMVTTTFNKYNSLKIDLPSSTIENVDKTKSIDIAIDKNMQYFILEDGKTIPVEFDKIDDYVKNAKEVKISADKDLKYQIIMELITKVKENGVENLGLNFTK